MQAKRNYSKEVQKVKDELKHTQLYNPNKIKDKEEKLRDTEDEKKWDLLYNK